LPEHELEGWQRGNRLGLRILCELGRRYPGIVQATGPVRRSRREQGCRFSGSRRAGGRCFLAPREKRHDA
jgi:hypothetical protein